jgi:hypothetical protein
LGAPVNSFQHLHALWHALAQLLDVAQNDLFGEIDGVERRVFRGFAWVTASRQG